MAYQDYFGGGGFGPMPGGISPQMSSGIGGGLGDLFAGWMAGKAQFNNPANAAMPYLNQIGGMAQQNLNPYIQAGQGAMGTLQNQYGQLINNPNAMMAKFGAGFQQSPGYQWQVDQATKAANNAAAAGGMAGSPMEQQNLAGTVNQLANQDYYNYLNNVEGLYGQGMQGMSGINQMGYGASNALTQAMMDQMMSQANLAYAGTNAQNQFNQQQQGAQAGFYGQGLGNLIGAGLNFL